MRPLRISPYSRDQLRPLLDARSIAIVGASENPTSFGARTLANLSAYGGRIHLVNPKGLPIGGRPCHPDIASLPETPDVAMMTIPREQVERAVLQCADRGVPSVVIGASGFAETGLAERIALQDRLAAIGRDADMRIVGPNCLGVVNFGTGQAMTFATVPSTRPRRRSVGIISQSGALGCGLAQSAERGTSISHMLTSGNSCDVDVADYIRYLAEDPGCDAIACLFEGMEAPERLIEAARYALSVDKPVVIHKLATGQQGAAAAMSHTGSLAGSDAAYRAAFEAAGMIVVDRYEALIETAVFFAKAPRPQAEGVVVVATSGGAAIMAADAADRHGVALPQPSAPTRAILESHIPEFGSSRNPCDVTAQVANNPQSLYACATALLDESAFGAMVVPHPYAYDFATPRIEALGAIAAEKGKPVLNVWVTENLQGPGAQECEANEHVAIFRSMDRCFAAIAQWHARERRRREAPVCRARMSAPASAAAATAALRDIGRTLLTEREAKRVLAAYGVSVVGEHLAASADEAVAAAERLGYPVALKVEARTIPHKTEAGVIRLSLKSAEEVASAFDAVMANALKVTEAREIGGVLVQPMVPAGIEMLVGVKVDPLFGPLVVVAFGGILVELLHDQALGFAPVARQEALSMLRRLKGAPLLQGYRNIEAVDLDALAEVIARVSEFADDHRDILEELDLNPLICSGSRVVAVDALVRLKSPQGSEQPQGCRQSEGCRHRGARP